jgi:general transcriptional corepressor TUP1
MGMLFVVFVVLCNMQGEPSGVSVAISPHGYLVIASYIDNIVHLWNFQTGQPIESPVGHDMDISTLAFTPDGKGFISGSFNGTLKHWDLSPLIGNAHGGMLRQSNEVGAEDMGSVAGQNEGVHVCMVEFIGHTVRSHLQFFFFLCLVSELLNLHYSQW